METLRGGHTPKTSLGVFHGLVKKEEGRLMPSPLAPFSRPYGLATDVCMGILPVAVPSSR